MTEYLHVERPFLHQVRGLGWEANDQGHGAIPTDPAASLLTSFRQVILPEVFREAVRAINLTGDGEPWLTDRQLDDLRDQLFRQGAAGLLEANEVAHRLLLKAQVDVNELTGEADPVVRRIDSCPRLNRLSK
jgi:type I restriction enzyme R subunit